MVIECSRNFALNTAESPHDDSWQGARAAGFARAGRRGALLMEVMLALVLFVTMGAVIIGVVRNVTGTQIRLRDKQTAIDLAASKMAELEAGLTTVEQLNGSQVDVDVPSDQNKDQFNQDTSLTPGRWRLDVESERSRFNQYSLVTIHVIDTHASSDSSGDGSSSSPLSSSSSSPSSGQGGVEVYVLRQLVLLKSAGGDLQNQDFGTDSDFSASPGQ